MTDERVSDEQLEARVASVEDWMADGVTHEVLPLSDILCIFRELQSRRSAPDRNAVIEECAAKAKERADYWHSEMLRATGKLNKETRDCCAFKRDGANEAYFAIRALKTKEQT